MDAGERAAQLDDEGTPRSNTRRAAAGAAVAAD
jgi:hypothetical protein